MLSTGAFNALLKTLEEPPEHVKFILATTEPQKLPATILSRCQRFDFKKISNENISKRLQYICDESKIEITKEALQIIAVLSEGAMRDALSILERCLQEGNDKIDEELVKELSKKNAEVMNSSADPFYGAKSLIIVFADTHAPTYLYDGALAMGNLMNAANALGVDSCWIHRAKEVFETEYGKELKNKWGIPESYEGIGHCILGYRDEELGKRAERTSKVVYA